MLGVVKVMVWPAAVELRNSTTPPLALASLLMLTVAPLPTGERLSASSVVTCADKRLARASRSMQANAASPMNRKEGEVFDSRLLRAGEKTETAAGRIGAWGIDFIFIF